MAIALAVSKSSAVISDEVAVTGSGFTASGNVDLEVVERDGLSFKYRVAATAGGAITGPTLVPGKPGDLIIKAHDVTADTNTSVTLKVHGGG